MKKVTMIEIAKHLGLSRNTVAKALSGKPVAAETRWEIIKTAKQLGYAKLNPQLLDELNKMKEIRKGSILLLFNRAESMFWKAILTGISDELKDHHYRMQLHIVDEADTDGKKTLQMIDDDVQGVVFLCAFSTEFIQEIAKAERPMTFFNATIDPAWYLRYGNVVSMEGKNAVYQLTRQVIEEGRRTFAFIGYPEGSINIKDRMDGMIQALNEGGIEEKERRFFTEYKNDSYYNYTTVEEVIQSLESIPDVIVCANDDIAKFAASALFKRDLSLAKQVRLIGFDNTIEEDFFKQDILTVHIRKEELGRRLIKTTIDKIENPDLDNSFIMVATYPIYKKHITRSN
ncbi:MAG: LacI family DNA-binding transcriptional regulator [Lachnospiraceae bacterium]|nr:LacI family DNA-binding transcriptional regulator [Lachnospiraceae bacterium]MDD3660585.1 LacI family DNA-binding transcriptional regulator [Lachnospiraceae bacterium]